MQQFRSVFLWMLCIAAVLAISGCNDDGTTTTSANGSAAQGTLINDPPLLVAHLTAADLESILNGSSVGQQLLLLAGTPQCGIDVHHIEYATVGAMEEATTATGALMVPNGSTAPCGGARPIVLYAHGTASEKTYNIADIVDTSNPGNGESALIAAMFAAQGYIVVAPNYAGYDTSTLPYHPYLNADQQSKDMIDGLTAARSALGTIDAAGTRDSGKLFITGYSQGGYVAMATQRALQLLGQTVTAVAPMSGPYAMEAMGDAVLTGSVNLASTLFIPMIINSYQKAYGDIYRTLTDVYSASYATGIDNLLPGQSYDELVNQGLLPQLALFSSTTPATGDTQLDSQLAVPSNPLFAAGFGDPYLLNNSVRIAYAKDAANNPDGFFPTPASEARVAATSSYPLREALRVNDMRYDDTFSPASPTLLCGGKDDPIVYFMNTEAMQSFWATFSLPAGLLTVLDLETGLGADDPFIPAVAGFAALKAMIVAKAVADGATDGGAAAVAEKYHGSLVPPFCTAAARSFFNRVLISRE